MRDIFYTNQALIGYFKQAFRYLFPKTVAYVSYIKALFQNEIELRLLPYLCDPKADSIDVGAFTGTYTIGACIHSKNVIAIEPQPKQAEALRRSIPCNVRIMETALSNVSGTGLLQMESPEGGSGSRLVSSSNEGSLGVPVRLMRMDDLDHGHVAFVKIDAEGHEIEVLEGAVNIIEIDKPSFLIEAEERYRLGAVAQVERFLQRFNYDGYFVYRREVYPIREFNFEKHQDASLIVSGPRSAYSDYINNFIFVHREWAATLPRKVPSAWRAIYEVARSSCLKNMN